MKSLENEEKKPHEEVNMCKQSGSRSSRTTKKPPAQDLKKKTPDFKTKPEKGNSKRKCKYCGKQMHNKRQDSDSDLLVLTVDVVSAIASKGKQVLAKLTFCIQDKYKTSMECQLDTGASCNVISHRDLSILLQNGSPPLNHSSVKLRLFDGSIMRTLGELHLTAEHEGKCHTLKFQVVDCTNKPLLSAEASERMGPLKFNFTPLERVNMVKNMADLPLTKEKI